MQGDAPGTHDGTYLVAGLLREEQRMGASAVNASASASAAAGRLPVLAVVVVVVGHARIPAAASWPDGPADWPPAGLDAARHGQQLGVIVTIVLLPDRRGLATGILHYPGRFGVQQLGARQIRLGAGAAVGTATVELLFPCWPAPWGG